jgi:hypothetical protein
MSAPVHKADLAPDPTYVRDEHKNCRRQPATLLKVFAIEGTAERWFAEHDP